MILADYHNHTSLCRHATGTVHGYLDKAIARGVTDYGFSCHSPMPEHFDPRHRMMREQLPAYLEWLEQARVRYEGRVQVKIALEADFAPRHVDYVRQMIKEYPYDYIIGSVHFLKNWGIDDPAQAEQWEKADVLAVYREYFDTIADAAETGMFDIIGHMDLVKKFGFFPKEDWSGIVDRALDRVARTGICVEINTSGLRKKVHQIYPADWIVRLMRAKNIPITLGADAHDEKDVAADLDRAIVLAREAGYTEYCTFAGRQRTSVPLPTADEIARFYPTA